MGDVRQKVDARKYRHPVTIQKPRSTDQIDLTDDDNWLDHCCRYAEVIPTGGREVLRGDQQVAVATHRVRMRSDELTRLVTPRFRLLWGERKLNIESVINVNEADQELELQCRELV